jgi:hypothetical protein
MPLRKFRVGEETSLVPSVDPWRTLRPSKTKASSIPENPIKDQSRVSLQWLISYYRRKSQGHTSICQKYLLKGKTDRAEKHRYMAIGYQQKKEALTSFRDCRMN